MYVSNVSKAFNLSNKEVNNIFLKLKIVDKRSCHSFRVPKTSRVEQGPSD